MATIDCLMLGHGGGNEKLSTKKLQLTGYLMWP